MTVLRTAKTALNRLLEPLNVRLDTLTAERVEAARLEGLLNAGHFDRAICEAPEQFRRCDPSGIFAAVKTCEPQFQPFAADGGSRGYTLHNDYYTSPDAEILYAMVRLHRPRRIVEVGSGNSTVLFRHAIED